ncbi:hypothetical protein QTP70_019532, partial [Hemibagrus guttatus]
EDPNKASRTFLCAFSYSLVFGVLRERRRFADMGLSCRRLENGWCLEPEEFTRMEPFVPQVQKIFRSGNCTIGQRKRCAVPST